MRIVLAFAVAAGLFVIGMLGAVPALNWTFGVALPYLAALLFFGGVIYRVLRWAASAVPFRIPTTCGQQRSLPWIRRQKLENPATLPGVLGRMALEVLAFRSLLRNTRSTMVGGRRLVHGTDLTLWLAALAMHWCLLLILIRHLRLMTNPVPGFVTFVERTDGFLQIGGLPLVFISSAVFLLALAYLLYRRLANPAVRYMSLPEDYFALFLLLGIGTSGFCLRHLIGVDVASVKQLALGLAAFAPTVPAGLHPVFYGHLFLVCVLAAYFPVGKLMHMPGIFLSPTRNLANNNRAVRHVNPWDYPVKVHSYEEYEDELREKMIGAGIPVERS
jgi:nitrate reductase gamma subunit